MDPETRQLALSVRRFLEDVVHSAAADAGADGPQVADVVGAHLGVPAAQVPVVREEVPEHQFVDLDTALALLGEAGGGEEVVGVGGGEQRGHHGFSDLLAGQFARFGLGAVDRVNLPTGPDSTRRAVGFGVRLLRWQGHPLAVLQRRANPHSSYPSGAEVAGAQEEVVAAFIAEVRRLMVERSVLRGQVLSFSGSPFEHHSNSGITFLRRPAVAAEDVVLPEGALERIARHVVGVGAHAGRLAGAGQHLKRGVLLYGPPGTGKTLTVRHLVARAEGCTVVLLSGQALGLVTVAAHLARAMQPAIVVLEDCDLVAEERGVHPGERPLLFQLLDAMDGLDGDADVAFLLTTNRVDLLERALAQRPGRVDLAVEVPLPDEPARRALFRLYARGLPVSGAVLDEAAARTAGVTASFAKELLRRAVLVAAEAGHEVGDDDVRAALDELLSDAEALTRSLLGSAGA
ncbi:AAA family ATPase [Kineococcus sp. T13]|uniref:AAA family ATPase n=1 Tax=Kineococcus vitellinus TaxID=2696565 RepID=UPI0014129978|nr:AAA family ATPase [Kineococcus vitellinus]NAZ75316.1 AAA family ATPase [Kineococcus vitellinus]